MDLDGFEKNNPKREIHLSQGGSLLENVVNVFELLDAEWYVPKARQSRWMDLKGDYAGDELFVIDGESLLQTVLDDPLLAIGQENDPSFQPLHAYLLLEKVLLEFISRSANFQITFFHKYRHITLQTGADVHVVASRTLGRVLLFKHLLKLNVPVHVFDGLEDPKWKEFHSLNKPMFILMNDGGTPDPAQPLSYHQVLVQRKFAYDVLHGQMAMALMKGIAYADSKISTFVFEPTRNANRKPFLALQGRNLNPLFQRAEHHLDVTFNNDSNSCDQHLAAHLSSNTRSSDEFILQLAKSLNPISSPLTYLFLIHWFHLPSLSVEDRAQTMPLLPDSYRADFCHSFLTNLFFRSSHMLSSFAGVEYDFDGRVFLSTIEFILSQPSRDIQQVVGLEAYQKANRVWSQLLASPISSRQISQVIQFTSRVKPPQSEPVERLKLLPFSNDVFDKYLPQLSLAVEHKSNLPKGHLEFGAGTVFSDTQHWHNSKSILPPHLGGTVAKPTTAWARMRQLRSNQVFMYNLQLQAATITGASGTILRQQTIAPVGKSKPKSNAIAKAPPLPPSKVAKKQKLSTKQALRDQIQQEKNDTTFETSKVWWKEKVASFAKLSPEVRCDELATLFRNKRAEEPILGLELRCYKLHLEIQMWALEPSPSAPEVHDKYAVSILKMVKEICQRKILTSAWKETLAALLGIMGFERYVPRLLDPIPVVEDVKPIFKFIKLIGSKSGKLVYEFMPIQEDPVHWQLRVFGEFMDRSMDSAPDRRVAFDPDAWQRRVLDCIDQNHSVLVAAPTSAGKTFISFYAMEKVLRSSNDGIIVYVAPTKALVTQITAEIYARFSKQLTGKSCWAIHTRDYRVNDPQKCQILVTVPEVLGIMLLSPALASTWTPRIKSIILDEIHSIGQQEGGAIWEQILLLAPCPIIGLSATIGSPNAFNNWLASVQEAHGYQHTFIQHPHRYSHLRKFFYVIGDTKKTFTSLDDHQSGDALKFIHPIGTLSFGRNHIPEDLALEARDTLSLHQALSAVKSQISDSAIVQDIENLSPERFFADVEHFLRQKDVLEYEAQLKNILSALAKDMDYQDPRTPLMQVIKTLRGPELSDINEKVLNSHPKLDSFLDNLIHLVADLHVSGDLPAILFNFDRTQCEVIAKTLYSSLVKSETAWKSTSAKWKQKIAQWEVWKAGAPERQRQAERLAKLSKRRTIEDAQDRQEAASTWEAKFNPNAPLPQFSFINPKSSYSVSELEQEIKKMKWRYRNSIPAWAFSCLRRGIAVHHAGMNKGYRSLVESLFRRGFVRIIIATGTLALGINAPAKTSVFCSDSPFLTALMYRQCAGRAGRRGYDLLGNVVFYGIPMDRVQRLILSRLPSLGGGFPVTSTLVLRLCNLLEESKRAPTVVKAIETLMSLPRVSFASDVGRDHLVHHIRFSIEYLRRSGLLNESGQAMNLFAIAGHLYYTEPSNLALVALMRSGALHEVCKDDDFESAKRNYILLMCHLFGRKNLQRVQISDEELAFRRSKYPSLIVLPTMPDVALQRLKEHGEDILKIFAGYALAFAEEKENKFAKSKSTLPLSGLKISGINNTPASPLTAHLRSTSIKVVARSPFIATSGHGDTFSSVQELADTVRNEIHLNAHAIPCIDHIVAYHAQSSATSTPKFQLEHKLNAYLYDFYTHGQVETLINANGIRRGDMWYLLEDFRLTLMTVRSALQQLLTKASREQLGTLAIDIDEELDSGYGGSRLDVEEGDANIDGNDDFDDEDTGFGQTGTGEDAWDVDGDFNRPKKVSDLDWRLYKVVSVACAEFDVKAKAMWA